MIDRLRTASAICAHWLRSLSIDSEGEEALRSEGLKLCEMLATGVARRIESRTPTNVLPDPMQLVAMDRADLLELSRCYMGGPNSESDCDLAIAHLATSFARADDLQATAALLKLAAASGAAGSLTAHAWDYVFSQQRDDGAFGLLAAEMALLKKSQSKETVHMALSIEVLGAMAASAGVTGLTCSSR